MKVAVSYKLGLVANSRRGRGGFAASGRAAHTMEFSHYDLVPRSVAEKVIEEARKPKA